MQRLFIKGKNPMVGRKADEKRRQEKKEREREREQGRNIKRIAKECEKRKEHNILNYL